MAGFGGFGTNLTGGGLFGAKPPEQGATGFVVPTTTITTTTTGLTFGTPPTIPGGTGLFGATQQTPTFGSGFGIKAITTANSGFTFGASPNTSATAFGAPANTSAPTFGAPANTSAPTFGVPANTSAPTFGVPASTPALSFGTPANTSASTFGGFGTTAAPTLGGPLSLGAPKTTSSLSFSMPSTSTAASTPSFNFGVTSAASTSAPLTFGTSNTTASTTTAPLTFGLASTTAGNTGTNLSFGVTGAALPTTTQSTGFTFNQPSTTTSLSFGTPKTTGSLTFGTTNTGFGTTTTSSTPQFNFGTSTTAAPTLGGGIFGAGKTTGNVSITTSTTTTSVGLGGVDNTQTNQGLSGSGSLEPKHAKDHTLPDPILQTLNDFQNFTKQQKSISVEISHGSSKPLKKVQEDTEAMESLLTMITSGLTRNAIAVDKLKIETAQGLHQAEMAQRNHETPPGLEYDNCAPSDYFNDLVTKFETDTVRLRVQIEASEKHLRSLTQSSTISPQELTLAMRRLHETLIVLAARVQALHTTVCSQKEQYKNLRRVYCKDDINVFDTETDQNRIKKQTIYSLRSLTGPTPFSETPGTGHHLHVDGLAMLACSTGASMPPTSSNPSWMSPLQGAATPGTLLPNSTLLSPPQPVEASGFQLSKPPTGNKRNKR